MRGIENRKKRGAHGEAETCAAAGHLDREPATREIIVRELQQPFEGFTHSVQIWTSADGGQSFYCCGGGKYFKSEQEATAYKKELEGGKLPTLQERHIMDAQIISISIQKGGTGKTTTAAALAQAAAIRGRKALAIDLDPQGNLSFTLGAETGKAGALDFLNGAPAADMIQHTAQGLDVIPAGWNLATTTSGKGTARRLQKALDPVRGNYDLIVIDTPPTAGELQYNALQAATALVIPLQADIYNIKSLYQITDTARQIQGTNPRLIIAGYILTQYDRRSTITRQMGEAIAEQAAAMDIPFLGTVRAAVVVKEAAALQRSLYQYAPKSKPAADYLAIYHKIMQEGET